MSDVEDSIPSHPIDTTPTANLNKNRFGDSAKKYWSGVDNRMTQARISSYNSKQNLNNIVNKPQANSFRGIRTDYNPMESNTFNFGNENPNNIRRNGRSRFRRV